MKYLCFIVFSSFLICSSSYGQEKVTIPRQVEKFGPDHWAWSISDNEFYKSYISDKSRYVLELPSSSAWGFTWVNIPEEVRRMDDYQDSELEFDLSIKQTNNGYFSIGFMFDLHNVSNQCQGGDFYLLNINGNTNDRYITAHMSQRKDCSWDGVPNPIIAKKATATLSNSEYNHVSIRKSTERYDIYINETNVFSFEYKGKLELAKLYYERGTYIIDNVQVNEIKYNAIPPTLTSNTESSNLNKPQIYVLLVGIINYDCPTYRQNILTGCVNDIRAMESFWKSTRGGRIAGNHIITLTDRSATMDNILRETAGLFERAKPQDIIITYFSGHGGIGSFCAYDGALSYERLNQIIQQSPATSKLFVVDACHAGSWNASSVLTSKGERLSEDEALKLFYDRLSSAGRGINWLLACKPDEVSSDGSKNGVFTEAILSGLNGAAEYENDNIITLNELYSYLKNRFDLYNKKYAGQYSGNYLIKQTPVIFGNGNREMPMSVVLR